MHTHSTRLCWLAIVATLTCPVSLAKGQSSPPNEPTAAEVDQFLAECKAAIGRNTKDPSSPIVWPSHTNMGAFEIAAIRREPGGPWVKSFFAPHFMAANTRAKAATELPEWKQMYSVLREAVNASPSDGNVRHNYQSTQLALCYILLRAEEDWPLLRETAQELFKWQADKARQPTAQEIAATAHGFLGCLSLKESDAAAARKHLAQADAGSAPPPHATLFLAGRLLKQGDPVDHQAVREFLNRLWRQWADATDSNISPEILAEHQRQLKEWTSQIDAGQVPRLWNQ